MKKNILVIGFGIAIAEAVKQMNEHNGPVLVVVKDKEKKNQERINQFTEPTPYKVTEMIQPYQEDSVINIYPKKSKYASGNQKYAKKKFF